MTLTFPHVTQRSPTPFDEERNKAPQSAFEAGCLHIPTPIPAQPLLLKIAIQFTISV